MNEIEYERQCEAAAIGEVMSDLVREIFDHFDATDLHGMGKSVDMDWGSAFIVAELHDGTVVYWENDRARDPRLCDWIRKVGVGGHVDGDKSGEGIPTEWIDLLPYADGTLDEFNRIGHIVENMVDQVDAAARELWNEINSDEEME